MQADGPAEPSCPRVGHTKAKEQREPDISQDGVVHREAVIFLSQFLHSTLKLKLCQIRLCWMLHYPLHQL